MKIGKTVQAADRAGWRIWLEANHSAEHEIWLVFLKKGTGLPSVEYREALEEALCFGWIDGIRQSIDASRYAVRFGPRRPGGAWSELNKHLAAKMAAEGRMTAAGFSKIDFPLSDAKSDPPKRPELALPTWLMEALKTNKAAWEFFRSLPASHRRNYIGWISDAKREETREKRIREAIALLERGERLGMK